MDPALVSALSAILGSLVGGSATIGPLGLHRKRISCRWCRNIGERLLPALTRGLHFLLLYFCRGAGAPCSVRSAHLRSWFFILSDPGFE